MASRSQGAVKEGLCYHMSVSCQERTLRSGLLGILTVKAGLPKDALCMKTPRVRTLLGDPGMPGRPESGHNRSLIFTTLFKVTLPLMKVTSIVRPGVRTLPGNRSSVLRKPESGHNGLTYVIRSSLRMPVRVMSIPKQTFMVCCPS